MKYELLYIIPATIADDELGKVEGEVSAILEKHSAKIEDTNRLGKLRFAYPIKKTRYGHYVRVIFDAEGESLAKIDAALRIQNNVLRYLIVRDEADGASPFTLVQYSEVVVETKDRRRRRKAAEREEKKASREDISSGVEAIESKDKKEEASDAKSEDPISDAELDKKLSDVLKKDESEA